MVLNCATVDVEKPDGICSLNFVVDEFSELFLYPIIFYYTFKICINNKLEFIKLLIFIKFQYLSVFRKHNYITKTFIFTNVLYESSFLFVLKE